MASDFVAIECLVVFRRRCNRAALAVFSILCLGARGQESRLRYGDSIEHASDDSVKDIVVECGAADRAEWVRDGLGDGCEDCANY